MDASDLAPSTIPFSPGAVPDVWVESLRQVGDIGERDLVGGKGRRRRDAGALFVFFESCLWRVRQIECLDPRPIETTAVDCRARAAGGQESPFGCQIAMINLVRTDLVSFTRALRSRDPG